MTNANITTCPARVNDLTGKTFGRWTVLGFTHTAQGYSFWLCRCVCGNEKSIRRNCLTAGHSASCGCLQKETATLARRTHGKSSSKEYKCWEGIIQRCTSKTRSDRYAKRGIDVCNRWRCSFEAFLEDMGIAPSENHSIDRIDNDGDYEPGNCRWATRSEQARNTSRNRTVTIDGVSKLLVEWVEEVGIKYNTVLYRILRGWPEREAIFTPTCRTGRTG